MIIKARIGRNPSESEAIFNAEIEKLAFSSLYGRNPSESEAIFNLADGKWWTYEPSRNPSESEAIFNLLEAWKTRFKGIVVTLPNRKPFSTWRFLWNFTLLYYSS